MEARLREKLLKEQIELMNAASGVLKDSYARVDKIFKKTLESALSIEEKESCEALTARFSRLCDYLFQRVFRTIDKIELQEEGSGIDRLNRMEKRGVINSAEQWRSLRDLRNEIAHDYLIEESDRVLHEAFSKSIILLDTVEQLKNYIVRKKYIKPFQE